MKLIYKKIDDIHILFSTPKREYIHECVNNKEVENVMQLLKFMETVGIIKKIMKRV
jgi:hypothetical protein